mmetsp:Transcript_1752/g.6276  ORF Transcript_1752/g.6276 Transcript_1752/m.6276 type:complete len:209 (+) Transcript_1752:3140-3766(+)
MVFVLGLKCAIPRKYSSVCLFFCNGYVAGSALPIISNSSTKTSTDCFPPGDSTTFPFTRIDAPVETSLVAPATSCQTFSSTCSCKTTICIPDMSEPSFKSINARSFCARFDRTQPFNSSVLPTFDFPRSFPLICARRSLLLYVVVVCVVELFSPAALLPLVVLNLVFFTLLLIIVIVTTREDVKEEEEHDDDDRRGDTPPIVVGILLL